MIVESDDGALDLPVRAYNAIRNAGVETIEELMTCDVKQLRKTRNFGKKSFAQLQKAMADKGIVFTRDTSSIVAAVELALTYLEDGAPVSAQRVLKDALGQLTKITAIQLAAECSNLSTTS